MPQILCSCTDSPLRPCNPLSLSYSFDYICFTRVAPADTGDMWTIHTRLLHGCLAPRPSLSSCSSCTMDAQLHTSPCTWGAHRIHPTVVAQSSPKLLLIFSNTPSSNPPTHAPPAPHSGLAWLCSMRPMPSLSRLGFFPLSPFPPTSGLVTGPPVHANTRRSSNVFHMIALDKALWC